MLAHRSINQRSLRLKHEPPGSCLGAFEFCSPGSPNPGIFPFRFLPLLPDLRRLVAHRRSAIRAIHPPRIKFLVANAANPEKFRAASRAEGKRPSRHEGTFWTRCRHRIAQQKVKNHADHIRNENSQQRPHHIPHRAPLRVHIDVSVQQHHGEQNGRRQHGQENLQTQRHLRHLVWVGIGPHREPEHRLHPEEQHQPNDPCHGADQFQALPEAALRRDRSSSIPCGLLSHCVHASPLSCRCRKPSTPAATAAPTQLKTV